MTQHIAVRYADSKEEATHRYPTGIYWGPGYFNDFMKYLVADSDEDAFEFVLAHTRRYQLQRRTVDGWEFVAPYPGRS